jgi:maltooligosyltrehalose trehalohydrolase
MTWKPFLGAVPDAGGTHFRVWAPKAPSLSVKLARDGRAVAMQRDADDYYTCYIQRLKAGERYLYKFPDGRERPDPASLFQPEGVHGPSEIVDLQAIAPREKRAPGRDLVISEIHLGTYTQAGTADAAAEQVHELAEHGFTAVEVMPVAAFSGDRGWGYDGVALFATQASYGGPAALARFVDAARKSGLATILDVVYNHLGPEGNYTGEYADYFTDKHHTPWGNALDFAKPQVRRFFLENVQRWTSLFDGLRLDAIHGIYDDSPKHILQEIAEVAHAHGAFVIAESDLNDPKLIDDYKLDGSWADDVHHCIHVALTGEKQGYYQDFQDPLPKLARAIERGWFYEGQHKPSFGKPHGKPAAHLPPKHFVVCAQNHDQIGNRANGERLVELAGMDGWKVAAAVIALQPAVPLYFQGEEWAAREPFLYFTGHTDEQLAEAVRKGRREEFKAFAWQGEVPDPQSRKTFERSKLDRSRQNPEALQWHQALLKIRESINSQTRRAEAQGEALLLDRGWVLLVANFGKGPYEVRLPRQCEKVLGEGKVNGVHLSGSGRQATVLLAR